MRTISTFSTNSTSISISSPRYFRNVASTSVENVVGVAPALDDAGTPWRSGALLDDLKALDRVVEFLQVVGEEGAGQIAPVGALDDRLHASLDVADRAAARGRTCTARRDRCASARSPMR